MVNRFREERDAAEKGESPRVNFKGAFQVRNVKKKAGYQRQMAMYNLRLIAILVVVIYLAYNFIQSPKFNYYFNQFFNSLKNKDGLY